MAWIADEVLVGSNYFIKRSGGMQHSKEISPHSAFETIDDSILCGGGTHEQRKERLHGKLCGRKVSAPRLNQA
jgi:hypothetical protein